MAAKRDDNLQPEIGRDLCRVRTEGGKYRGYRKNILIENLSERDNAIFVCPRCKGILRELCMSTDGEQFCSCCKKEGEQTNPNIHMNNMILCFKCCCPLMVRGCGWLGTLGDCEIHLDTCGYVEEKCKQILQFYLVVTHKRVTPALYSVNYFLVFFIQYYDKVLPSFIKTSLYTIKNFCFLTGF